MPDHPWHHLRVPASSANLGPGFDALAMALDIPLCCRFRRAETLSIRATGRDADLIPTDASNLIWQTALGIAESLGRTLPTVELALDNRIPLGKGLGSSAAALTAGVVLADHLLGLRWDRHRILDEAARIEGHPDNVAACVLGSIVASAVDSDGVARAVRLELPAGFDVAVIVPDFPLPTAEARAVLPLSYSRQDAIFNIQRAALLMAALATGTTSAFPVALQDRLHQPQRAALVPGLDEMVALRSPGLLGCVLSGAGPSVLVFFERGHDAVCAKLRSIFARHGHDSELFHASLNPHGYTLD